jgi:hypothetical protein
VRPRSEPRGATISRHLRIFIAAVLGSLVLCLPGAAGAATHAELLSYSPSHTAYTGIDPGPGLQHYTYAPSTVQTSSTTRYVFYCGNLTSGLVQDHVFVSVGHRVSGQWRYGTPTVAFGPDDGPPGSFFAVHTCEPEVIGGGFRFGGHPYKWVMFFTAEAVASNSTNVIGLAFANSLTGPWRPDLTPFVQTSDDFGTNGYPNNCPVDKASGQTFYCLGEPAATTIGGGRVLLTYMGNSGSPGNDSNPAEGLVLRELNLSNVPAVGPCTTCFVGLPDGNDVEAVTQAGLHTWPHDASIAYDPARQRVVMSFDNGPYNTSTNGAPVTPVVTVATIGVNGLLRATGSWTVQGSFGECLSGYTLNHNSGIVRTGDGDLPSSGHLEVLYAVANDNLGSEWGVWDYRLWDVSAPLTGAPGGPTVAQASSTCAGLSMVTAAGRVTTGGSAHPYGSVPGSDPHPPVTGIALTPDHRGYYLVTSNGRVLTYGDAVNLGSVPRGLGGTARVVGVAVDTGTGGYWIARANGSVIGVGAPSLGSFGATAASGPVVALAATPNGEGYYVVTSNGDVGAFGHANSFGNFTPPAGQTVTTMATTPDGLGYYLVTGQGTIAAFGNAQLFGPAVMQLGAPVAAMAVSSDGFGYWIATTAGTLAAYGDASQGLAGAVSTPSTAVGLAAS